MRGEELPGRLAFPFRKGGQNVDCKGITARRVDVCDYLHAAIP